ncbi:MAG TPA: DUF2442 domain-containing protein [Anaerolineae bacterium]|nr:DUF2442 domain-containing protein [Anaerolineae bacterium]
MLNISQHGFWLLVHGKEYFLAFDDFPWFRNATIVDILAVELPQPDHLYWPALDVDLHLDSLEHPERYPLVYNS